MSSLMISEGGDILKIYCMVTVSPNTDKLVAHQETDTCLHCVITT